MPSYVNDLADLGANDTLLQTAEDYADAWRLIEEGYPCAGAHTVGTRTNESPRRWRGPLDPYELFRMIDTAQADDPNYLTQLRANTDYYTSRDQDREAARQTRCGRTIGHATCKSYPTFMPPHGLRSGWPCRSHLDDHAKAAVKATYQQAVTDIDCPGCIATAGQACFTADSDGPRLRLVDGHWPRKYTTQGITVHDARLLALPTYPTPTT